MMEMEFMLLSVRKQLLKTKHKPISMFKTIIFANELEVNTMNID